VDSVVDHVAERQFQQKSVTDHGQF
jgi:hypothetical protein